MVQIYKGDSHKLRKEKKLADVLLELPKSLHERALRYRFEEDAFNFVLGRLLLKQGLEKLGLKDQLEKIKYDASGKPHLDTVFFNISHSDNLVVCALSTDGPIGIDVEKEKVIAIEDFKTWWFTPKEWDDITNAKHPPQKFFWYWTRKESIIKALGVKLSYLHQIELDPAQDVFIEKGKRWYLKDLDFGPGFYGAMCTEMVGGRN